MVPYEYPPTRIIIIHPLEKSFFDAGSLDRPTDHYDDRGPHERAQFHEVDVSVLFTHQPEEEKKTDEALVADVRRRLLYFREMLTVQSS